MKRVLLVSLIMTLGLNETGCLKRVSVQKNSPQISKSHSDIVYVYLKPGMLYQDKDFLTVNNPKLEGEYLVGTSKQGAVKIPLDNIDSVDVVKYDKKKVIIWTTATAAIFLAVGIVAAIYNPIHFGSVD